MKRGVALLLGLLACTPNGDPPEPLGGLVVHLGASPTTLGQPFQTDDGWEVRVERAVGLVDVRPCSYMDYRPDRFGSLQHAHDDEFRGMRSAPCSVHLWSFGLYEDTTLAAGASPAERDEALRYGRPFGVRMRGERQGRSLTLDCWMVPLGTEQEAPPVVEIPAFDKADLYVVTELQQLLRTGFGVDEGPLRFDTVAYQDAQTGDDGYVDPIDCSYYVPLPEHLLSVPSSGNLNFWRPSLGNLLDHHLAQARRVVR